MEDDYKNHHYVPQWYQKKFMIDGESLLWYLDLKPRTFTSSNGKTYNQKSLRRQGSAKCFAQNDLYTTSLTSIRSKDVEKYFFGRIDSQGKTAVDFWNEFNHTTSPHDFFEGLLTYMSTQKLRTPKGLSWLKEYSGSLDKNKILATMVNIRNIYCATWADCVWQIADAELSAIKFIVSDHPVTVYNRACGPKSGWCSGSNDPDILYNATHTIFPLSFDKVLIMTNLSWVRNPYQKEMNLKPNPELFRDTIIRINDIQITRKMSDQEVLEINFIIKSRACQFIAAAKEEWLYPEKNISKSNWNTFGNGYLCMPDPRSIHLGGELFWGGLNGSPGGAMDEYGRSPFNPEYRREGTSLKEGPTLHRFQGEFSRLHGKRRRGRSISVMDLDNEEDDDDFHQYHLGLEQQYKKKNKH
jgi:hypothetical protein